MNAPTEATLQQDTATLYERLGSRPGIEAIVEDIWNNHVSNPLVNKRYANSDPATVKRLVTEMCCAGFGGPETYTGRDMLATHKGMNINDTEFVAVCDVYDARRAEALKLAGGQAEQNLDYPDMLARRSGRIIMVTSIAADLAAPRSASYVAAKGGLAALVRASCSRCVRTRCRSFWNMARSSAA